MIRPLPFQLPKINKNMAKSEKKHEKMVILHKGYVSTKVCHGVGNRVEYDMPLTYMK
jgi:hypothetical protein